MTTKPLISVLMPLYNNEKYVEKAIESILNQTYQHFELLIQDDKSTDNSRQKAQSYKDQKITIFFNSENMGYLRTCNSLFNKCSGDYITFQDSDDWSDPNRLERQVKEFEKSPQLGICGTYAQYVDVNGKFTRTKEPQKEHLKIKEEIRERNQFCGASIMIPKAVLNEVGGYRDYYDRIGNEDYDWSARIVEKYAAMNIGRTLYFVRQTPGSITRSVRDKRQLISEDMVRHFIKQRKMTGTDDIRENNLEAIQKKEGQLIQKYLDDSSLMYRIFADKMAYNKMRYSSFLCSYQALKKAPSKWINWKYLISTGLHLFSR